MFWKLWYYIKSDDFKDKVPVKTFYWKQESVHSFSLIACSKMTQTGFCQRPNALCLWKIEAGCQLPNYLGQNNAMSDFIYYWRHTFCVQPTCATVHEARMTLPVWFCMWLFRAEVLQNSLPQALQLYGFSPVLILKCILNKAAEDSSTRRTGLSLFHVALYMLHVLLRDSDTLYRCHTGILDCQRDTRRPQ